MNMVENAGNYKGYELLKSTKFTQPIGVIKINFSEDRLIGYNPIMCSTYTDSEFKALCEHEIGHLELNHVSVGNMTKQQIEADLYLTQEIEADLYSANEVGKDTMLQTLYKTLDLVNNLNDIKAIAVINNRIRALKGVSVG